MSRGGHMWHSDLTFLSNDQTIAITFFFSKRSRIKSRSKKTGTITIKSRSKKTGTIVIKSRSTKNRNDHDQITVKKNMDDRDQITIKSNDQRSNHDQTKTWTIVIKSRGPFDGLQKKKLLAHKTINYYVTSI